MGIPNLAETKNKTKENKKDMKLKQKRRLIFSKETVTVWRS